MPDPERPARAPLPLRPVPAPSQRPWAGSRLAAYGDDVGELWLAGPASVVEADDGSRATLDELAERDGEALVGAAGLARYGRRFPLLAKLIDAGDWLSLQVHPSDALARELHGPDAVGKAEAWVVLEADPDASLIVGPAVALAEGEVRRAIAGGVAGRAHCRAIRAVPGDALLIRPGTLHAIGGGTFLYELQQPSDLTYRVSDWGRSGRRLHIAESLRAFRGDAVAERRGSAFHLDGDALEAPEFRLELVADGATAARAPGGRSPEVVTALRGTLELHGDGWSEPLATHETLVVPAATDAYAIVASPGALAAVGTVP